MKSETADHLPNSKTWTNFVATVLPLSLLLFVLLSIDFVTLSLSVRTFDVEVARYFVALLDSAAMALALTNMEASKGKLFLASFALFFGVTSVLVALEAVYLGPLFPVATAVQVTINGVIRVAAFSAACVILFSQLNPNPSVPTSPRVAMSLSDWVRKIVAGGIVWALLFVLFGFFVYFPLASSLDPVALQMELSTNLPAWTVPFQAIHGMIWIALTVPMIKILRVQWKRSALLLALVYGVLSAGNLIVPTGMSPGLQAVHLAEVFGESFAFGIVVAWLFTRRAKP